MTDCGYVDDDFVLRGTKPALWDKPGHRMNSHCSSTTKTLTQSTLYAPDNYRDYLDYGMAGQSASMKKTVSFNQWNGNGVTPVNGVGGDGDSPQSSTTGSVTNGTAGGHKSKPVGKKEKDATSWCTRPVHLAIAFPAHTTVIHPPRPSAGSPSGGPRLAGKGTNGYMCSAPDTNGMDAVTSPLTSSVTSPLSGFNDQTMMLTNRPTSAPAVSDRMAGVAPITPPTNNGFLSPASPPVGHSLTDMLSSGIKGHRTASASFHDKVTTNGLYMETLASEYFPLTFGLSKPAELEVRQQPQIYNHPIWKHSCTVSSWRQPRRAKSPGRKRPGSAHSSSSSNSKSSIDKAYLMAVEAPAHAANSAVLLSTPYQQELAKLRMERLRIEEEHILEVKRQEELERIRGPRPKWYMMKSREFNYELHKNTELLQNKDNWQDLLDYRMELERASKSFQRSRNSTS